MSQRHLYTLDYQEFNPPLEWVDLQLDGTIIDNVREESLVATDLTFVGKIASFIQDTYIPTYGIFNGLHYRIEVKNPFDGEVSIVFDGYIDLSRRVIQSESGPIIFTAPIVDFTDNATTLQKMAIESMGLLRSQGFINATHFVDIPTIKESKKNIAERTLILAQLLNQIVTAFLNMVQDLLSALSDILGISLPVGIIELVALAINTNVQVDTITNNVQQHKDLFFPSIRYYKGISMQGAIEGAFAKFGKTVEFGILEDTLKNIYLMPSQSGFDGFSVTGVAADGQLKSNDAGYFIGDLLNTIQEIFNTKYDDRGDVVHIKWKYDDFWFAAPEFEPTDTKIETTEQHQNGTKKEDTESVFATFYFNYATDPSDAHTLTEKADDFVEIHRNLITKLDPRTNTLKGLKEIKVPYPLCVRKVPFDNLFELFLGINDQFDFYLTALKNRIEDFAEELADSPVGDIISDVISNILDATGISTFLENRTGVLKIEDNAFDKAKILYMVEEGGKLKIPENFKDRIGGRAIYNEWHLRDSPADVNDFGGQRTLINNWTIPFNQGDYVKTKENPHFSLLDKDAKFTFIGWNINRRLATTNAEVTEVFDRNITETEIIPE